MFRNILVPVDLSEREAARRALAVGARLAADFGAELHALAVVPDVGMSIVGSFLPPSFEGEALAEAKAQLKAFLAEATPEDVPVKGHVAHGGIYREILRVADALAADLIVVSSHRPTMQDYLLGPNAARVVRHARQSVMVLRD